jgi:hypothetical protein
MKPGHCHQPLLDGIWTNQQPCFKLNYALQGGMPTSR